MNPILFETIGGDTVVQQSDEFLVEGNSHEGYIDLRNLGDGHLVDYLTQKGYTFTQSNVHITLTGTMWDEQLQDAITEAHAKHGAQRLIDLIRGL